MARVLHEFQASTKAIASEVNENFAAVQEDINDMGSALDTYFKAELTKTKEDILTDFEEAKTTKLNVDMSNIGEEGKENLFDYITPDYTKSYTVNSGFVAPVAGWVIVQMASGEGKKTVWYIDGVEVARDDQSSGGGRAGRADSSAMIFIGKNQTLTITTNYSKSALFVPCTAEERGV